MMGGGDNVPVCRSPFVNLGTGSAVARHAETVLVPHTHSTCAANLASVEN